jgi:plasmid maintenance system killer protein
MSIKSFSNKGVEEIFRTGRSRRIGPEFHQRMSLVLDALDGATEARDCVALADFMCCKALDPEPSPWRSAAIGG